VTYDDYAWWAQLGLSLVFAALVARVAGRKGRHPFGAALLVLALGNGWPIVWEAVGRGIATKFGLNDLARRTMARVFGLGGLMFGVVLGWIIVGCWRPRRRPPTP
jgi:hypothetical protein